MLKLITASRISKEKGFNRVIKLAQLLNDNNIPFEWNIYGEAKGHYYNSIVNKTPKQVIFHGYKENLTNEIKNADYLVSLSDTEGFSYSTYEALQLLTPCIVTNYPSAKEQIEDGVNGWILDFNLKDWEKILQKQIKLTNFVEKSSEKDWIEIIEMYYETSKNKST